MTLNTEPIKNWFGFTRRERRSTFSLLVLIVVLLIIRYTVPASKVTVKNISDEIIETEESQVIAGNDSSTNNAGVKLKKPYIKSTFGKGDNPLKVRYILQQEDRKNGNRIIDINRSDTSALITLPGIGPILSARIVKYRNFLGGFAKIDQLKEVYGLSEETFEIIKTRVKADSSFITRININTADYKELSKVRYLEKYEIISILKYRQLNGKINALSDLVDNKLISSEKAKKVEPYVRFD